MLRIVVDAGDVGVVDEAVDHCRGDSVVSKGIVPAAELLVRCDDDGRPLAVGEDNDRGKHPRIPQRHHPRWRTVDLAMDDRDVDPWEPQIALRQLTRSICRPRRRIYRKEQQLQRQSQPD